MAAMPASPEELLSEPAARAIAPSIARNIGTLSRCARSTLRSTWFWVTWTISCASTPATSSSDSAVSTRPTLRPI